MNKRVTILLAVLLLLVLFSLFYFYSPSSPKVQKDQNYIVTMTGHITEVKRGVVAVSGLVMGETKVVEFAITPETTFTKDVLVISASQIKSEESFTPETKTMTGKSSELAKDMAVRIRTTDNLAGASRVNAFEINYTTYDLPY